MKPTNLRIFNSDYFSLNKRLLQNLGLWPYDDYSNQMAHWILMMFLSLFFWYPQLLAMKIWCGKDIALCGENVSGWIFFLECNILLLYAKSSNSKMEIVYEIIARNWSLLTNPEEKAILQSYAQFGRFISALYVGFMVFGAVLFSQAGLIVPILDIVLPLNESRKKIFVIRAEYGFDPNKYYFIVYVMYSVAVVVGGSAFAGIDTMYFVVSQQCAAIFAILRLRLQKATECNSDEDSRAVLVTVIELHKQALQFIDALENSYSFLILMMAGLGLLCTFGAVAIFESLDDTILVLKYATFGVGAYIHIFLWYWSGQILIDENEELFQHTFMIQWYSLSPGNKKILSIMMMRCIEPCFLTAGGLIEVNFENLGKMWKTSFSYIMLAT